MPSAVVLAQSGTQAGQAVVWIAVLIVVVVAAGVGVLVLRRKFFGAEGPGAADPGSLLETLRGMRDRGEMSSAEFDRAREALLRKATGDVGGKPPVVGVAANGSEEARVAAPGFDLLGEPLPPRDSTGPAAGE